MAQGARDLATQSAGPRAPACLPTLALLLEAVPRESCYRRWLWAVRRHAAHASGGRRAGVAPWPRRATRCSQGVARCCLTTVRSGLRAGVGRPSRAATVHRLEEGSEGSLASDKKSPSHIHMGERRFKTTSFNDISFTTCFLKLTAIGKVYAASFDGRGQHKLRVRQRLFHHSGSILCPQGTIHTLRPGPGYRDSAALREPGQPASDRLGRTIACSAAARRVPSCAAGRPPA